MSEFGEADSVASMQGYDNFFDKTQRWHEHKTAKLEAKKKKLAEEEAERISGRG